MKTLKYKLLFIYGLIFTLGSLGGIYYWYYRIAPLRNIIDPIWCDRHSEQEIWEEQIKNYQRTNSPPDTFFRGDRIGQYGDSKWLTWLVDNIENGMPCCGCGLGALAYMTNHNFDKPQDYVDWLKKHRNESQEDLIQLGFLKYGITVSKSIKQSDPNKLLECIGNDDKDKRIPYNVKYNACRWLRDSGFELVPYMMNDKAYESNKRIKNGLLTYSKFLECYPRSNNLGILNLIESKEKEKNDEFLPIISTIKIQVIASSIIWGFLALGLLMIAYSFKFKHKTKWFHSSDPDTHG